MWIRGLFLAGVLTAASAHTYHTSIAQIDYITSKKALEVIVWIHAEDIERVMRERLRKNATLDNQKEAERFLRAYLKDSFVIRTSAGKTLSFQWVGLEVRTHFIAAYFEIPAPDGLTALTLTNRILLDALPDQVNTVKVKWDGAERRDLTFNNIGAPATQPLAVLQSR